MLSRERNVMLSEISMILEVCKSLVSRLSSQDVEVCIQSAPANTQQTSLCSDDEMWWDQSDVSGQMSFDPNNNSVDVVLNDILEDVQLFPTDVSDVDDCEDSIAQRVKLRKLSQLPSSATSFPDVQQPQLATSKDLFIEQLTSCYETSV